MPYLIVGFAALLIGFIIWNSIRERKAGGAAVTAKVATKTVEVQQKMDQAAAKADPTKAGVKKSLEDGSF